MSFREFTFCNTDQIQIMVAVGNKSGRVIRMYCYADHMPHFEHPETGKETKISFLKMDNPLFVEIKNRITVLKKITQYGDYVPLLDDTDDDYSTDYNTLIKCFSKYGIVPHDNVLSY